ncbi:MAG: ribonuclease R [Pseudomonadota bacterium]
MSPRKDSGIPTSSKSRKSNKDHPPLPTKNEILDFIRLAPDKVGKREIARAFHIKSQQKIEFKRLLREMTEEGLLSGNRKSYAQPGVIPRMAVLEVKGLDEHGDSFAIPVKWDRDTEGPEPKVLLKSNTNGKGQNDIPGIGERILARVTPQKAKEKGDYPYNAIVVKKLAQNNRSTLGIYRKIDGKGGLIDPIDKKNLRSWSVAKGDENQAQDGELVKVEVLKAGRFGLTKARVKECLGNPDDQQAISLIAIHAHGIRDEFPTHVIAESEELGPCPLEGRDDLRKIPLITIDPADARDHDDAVWASPDDNPENKDGWVVIVAIADVAYYVRPASALDYEGLKRGNSTYFPDRVVPMLPERISNNLCSLRFGEERPCLAVRMVFNKDGQKIDHTFIRALMTSAAKLSYEQAQAAIDGKTCEITAPLLDPILKPLWSAYRAVQNARTKRAPLELDMPERKIILDNKGQISEIKIPQRLDAHKLIEEFMIQANVCAAETLEAKRSPLIYRVHDAPSEEKIVMLSDFLSTLDIKLPKSGVLKPQHFNGILTKAEGTPTAHLVNEMVLRSQSQAEYTPDNAGHFGLNLRRYAHFTSPIRRYADLIVHRALISALMLSSKDGEKDGITEAEISELPRISEDISAAERKSMAAERDTVDRLVSSYLADHLGATFEGRISGVTRSGLFVRLADSGADGFIPASTMHDDYYRYVETQQALIGERTRQAYVLGDTVSVRLAEVVPSAGAIRFELLSDGKRLKSFPTQHRSSNRSSRQRPTTKSKRRTIRRAGRKK